MIPLHLLSSGMVTFAMGQGAVFYTQLSPFVSCSEDIHGFTLGWFLEIMFFNNQTIVRYNK